MSSPFQNRKHDSPSGRLAALASDTSRRIQQSLSETIKRPRTPLLSSPASIRNNETIDVDSLIRSLYQSTDEPCDADDTIHTGRGQEQHQRTMLAQTTPSLSIMSSSSSYVPTEQADWVLDGKAEWLYDAKESERLLQELEKSSNLIESLLHQENPTLNMLQMMEMLPNEDDDDDMVSSSSSTCVVAASFDDDFGEFQTAEVGHEAAEGDDQSTSEFAQAGRDLTATMLQIATNTGIDDQEDFVTARNEEQQDLSPDGGMSTSTNELLERVDALLQDPVGSPPQCSSSLAAMQNLQGSPDTFRLVQQTENMLQTTKRNEHECYPADHSPPNEEKKQEAPFDFGDYQTPLRHVKIDFVNEMSTSSVTEAPRQFANRYTTSLEIFDHESAESDSASEDRLENSSSTKPMAEIQFANTPFGRPPLHASTPPTGVTSPLLRNNISGKSTWNSTSPHVTPNRTLAVDGEMPLSLELLVQDLSTAAARFTRRRQLAFQHHDMSAGRRVDEVLERMSTDELDLPEHFFKPPDSDSFVKTLSNLPWHLLQDGGSDNGVSEWDEYMVDKLSTSDAALEQVNRRILEDIQQHELNIGVTNDLVHDLEQSLRLSSMYSCRCTRAIELAWGDERAGGLITHTVLPQWWEERHWKQELDALLQELECIFSTERDLSSRIDSFDCIEPAAFTEYLAVTELAEELQATIRQDRLKDLLCLNEMRLRLTTINLRFWDRLRFLAGSMMVQCCREKDIDWLSYGRLLQTALRLHMKEFKDSQSVDFAMGWSQTIDLALRREADRAFAVALLEPAGACSSRFDDELTQLRGEIDGIWDDGAKLRAVTHNLVSVRFTFEPESSCLSRVLCRLLERLVDILRAFQLLIKYHSPALPSYEYSLDNALLRDSSDESPLDCSELKAVYQLFSSSRQSVWSKCESVIIHCFDEYLKFAATQTLFSHDAITNDDALWRQDLTCLHECLCLTSRFVAMRDEFVGSISEVTSKAVLPPMLHEKLEALFRRHLDAVHAAAMTCMGRMLANETWMLCHLHLDGTDPPITDPHRQCINSLLREAVKRTKFGVTPARGTARFPFGKLFEDVCGGGNPFGKDFETVLSACYMERSFDEERTHCQLHLVSPVYCKLLQITSTTTDTAMPVFAAISVVSGLVGWCGRLLAISEALPLLVDGVSSVAMNLFDLFFTTVLRLCAGSARGENLLLGIDAPTVIAFPVPAALAGDAKFAESTLFSSFRKSTMHAIKSPQRRPSTQLSSHIESEICSPLLKEKETVANVRRFIQRASTSLGGLVNLNKVDSWLLYPPQRDHASEEHSCRVAQILEKRIGALCSCYVAAALVDAFQCLTREKLASSNDELDPLSTYVNEALRMTPTLVSIGSRCSCMGAVGGNRIVAQILEVDNLWEGRTLKENPNDYTEELAERCSLLWGYLSISAKLPPTILNPLWEDMLSAASLSLLEGFARVPLCSTEGRALMALDLASLFAGTSPDAVIERLEKLSLDTQPPPSFDVSNCMKHVGTYIKVYYYPPDDVMSWIKSNCADYHLHQTIALIVATAGPKAETSALVERVKTFYR